jgi:hypothetical protein
MCRGPVTDERRKRAATLLDTSEIMVRICGGCWAGKWGWVVGLDMNPTGTTVEKYLIRFESGEQEWIERGHVDLRGRAVRGVCNTALFV